MKRSGRIQRSKPLKPGRRKSRTTLERERSAAWHWAVMAAPEFVVCSSTEDHWRGTVDRVAHHAVLQQVLRRRARELELPPHVLVWDPRVGMKVSRRRHERHHSGHERILRADLPQAVYEFVDEYGLREWLDRHYLEGPGA